MDWEADSRWKDFDDAKAQANAIERAPDREQDGFLYTPQTRIRHIGGKYIVYYRWVKSKKIEEQPTYKFRVMNPNRSTNQREGNRFSLPRDKPRSGRVIRNYQGD